MIGFGVALINYDVETPDLRLVRLALIRIGVLRELVAFDHEVPILALRAQLWKLRTRVLLL